MEINNNSYTQKSSEVNKLSNSSPKTNSDKKYETEKEISVGDNILINQKNELSLIQTRITGFESLKNSLEKTTEEPYEKIDEIVDKSRFHNQKVLEPYADELKNAKPNELPAKVDYILSQLKGERQEVLSNIEKTEISEENKLSLESWNKQKNPEELLQQVLSSMEGHNNLFNDIPVERIKDLLSD
ncbi:MAG: hypothetical protein JXR70_05145 [Spirochaetales bacterium]|nr:hypothetical protein [Spirochaetales bacterium]